MVPAMTGNNIEPNVAGIALNMHRRTNAQVDMPQLFS